jgi:predicted HTH domain antitoxin
MASVTLELPDDLLEPLAARGKDPAQGLRLAAAFSLCGRGEISTSQAARLAGLTYAGFLEAAARAKVDLFQYTIEEITEEIDRGFTLGRQRLADPPVGQASPDIR